ncbi:hypothetical protein [Branchiibius hedensis]|uniref:hypothetical protein n=1 Tax=Branchiibius hedensis TaxID=672460 RepID=UPI001B86EB97|nr:hypothetical protein [Branchiibius hedensis]
MGAHLGLQGCLQDPPRQRRQQPTLTGQSDLPLDRRSDQLLRQIINVNRLGRRPRHQLTMRLLIRHDAIFLPPQPKPGTSRQATYTKFRTDPPGYTLILDQNFDGMALASPVKKADFGPRSATRPLSRMTRRSRRSRS